MIPTFPKFKKLSIKDKKFIEKHTNDFLPFSDFNFVSLYGWDTDGETEISLLENNLVIKFSDYLNNEIFLSFFGSNNETRTALTLIGYAKKVGIDPALRLISPHIAKNIRHEKKLIVKEDRDNFDYILSVDELINLQGGRFRGKKNFINRFNKYHAANTIVLCRKLDNLRTQKEVLKLFSDWDKKRVSNDDQSDREFAAINRIFKASDIFGLKIICIYVDNQLVGFSINEILENKYGMIHFQKANTDFIGIYAFLKQQSAIDFKQSGCKYINYQQDMGIENLRKAKLAYHPVKLLKKYTVRLKHSS